MKIRLVYPRWSKLEGQTEFHLPPHGPVVFAAAVPPDVDLQFVDENVQELDDDTDFDLVCLSVMLTAQIQRAWQIADTYRAAGVPVIFGGIATMLHAEQTMQHADAVFLGEIEGRFEAILDDLRAGELKPLYDHRLDFPAIESVGTARRDILQRDFYNVSGVQMVDLVHASRGCRFSCFPCCVEFLGGRQFRPRPYDRVVAEIESIDNDRLFLVDNSLAQDDDWVLGLFDAIGPLNRHWISHPLPDKEHVVRAAAKAGCWYVYQAIFDTSDHIRNRVRRLKDHGIAVEGTILLGLDDHTPDTIKELVDFLLEIELDIAEFTVLTPFPHSRSGEEMRSQGRILSENWDDYTADKVVFQPAQMSPDELQELYHHAWDTFYRDEPQRFRMFRLLKRVL